MRLRGRRRSAGVEQMPNDVVVPDIVVQPLGPIVLRLGPGGGLLDLPGPSGFDTVANVWPSEGAWVEARWPRHPTYGWPIAPIDLRLGHVLEFRGQAAVVYGWVVDVQHHSFVFVVTADRERAYETATVALARWNAQRIDRLR